MISVKKKTSERVLECCSEYPDVCDLVPGGTWGTQNRTRVSFNRGYAISTLAAPMKQKPVQAWPCLRRHGGDLDAALNTLCN